MVVTGNENLITLANAASHQDEAMGGTSTHDAEKHCMETVCTVRPRIPNVDAGRVSIKKSRPCFSPAKPSRAVPHPRRYEAERRHAYSRAEQSGWIHGVWMHRCQLSSHGIRGALIDTVFMGFFFSHDGLV